MDSCFSQHIIIQEQMKWKWELLSLLCFAISYVYGLITMNGRVHRKSHTLNCYFSPIRYWRVCGDIFLFPRTANSFRGISCKYVMQISRIEISYIIQHWFHGKLKVYKTLTRWRYIYVANCDLYVGYWGAYVLFSGSIRECLFQFETCKDPLGNFSWICVKL